MHRYRFFILLAGLGLMLVSNRASSHLAAPGQATIVLNNPYCVQPSPALGTCVLNARNVSVSSSDPNFTGLQVTVNGNTRAFLSAFFETAVYLTDDMLGPGLQVACGLPNAGGVAGYGYRYTLGFSAIISGNPASTDTAEVSCPAFESKTYMPLVKK